MAGRNSTREDDDFLLYLIEQRHLGRDTYELSQEAGVTPSSIRTLTNRVLEADCAASGKDVSAHYWVNSSRRAA